MEVINTTGPAATQNSGLHRSLLYVCLYIALSCCLLYSILMFLFAVNFVIFSLRATILINLNLNLNESENGNIVLAVVPVQPQTCTVGSAPAVAACWYVPYDRCPQCPGITSNNVINSPLVHRQHIPPNFTKTIHP